MVLQKKKGKKKRKKITSCCGERARLSRSDALSHRCPSIPEDVCHAHQPSPARRFQFCSWTLRGTFHKTPSLALPRPPPHASPPIPFWWKGCQPTPRTGAQTRGGHAAAPQHPHPGASDQAHQLHLHRRRCCSRGTQMTSSKTKGKALTMKDLTALLVIPI